ncbi:MAG: hypothetical protein JWN76_476 [Chitinophagaceae bacterium]|nr:hypothetical protein [Chitinophagaceae bacterium]
MENEKINVLLKENQNLRSELTMVSKTVHNSFFAFITTFGLFIGLLANIKSKEVSITNSEISIMTFIVSQIEIIIIVYNVLLSSDIFAKAAYIAHIETKINELLKDKLIFWETSVSPFVQRKGTLLLSEVILYCFYSGIFISLSIYGYDKNEDAVLPGIQIIEILLVCYLLFKMSREYANVKKYIAGTLNEGQKNSGEPRDLYLVPAVTFIAGIYTFSIIGLHTHSFWFHSDFDVPILKSPSLYLGDSIFIPLFNYLLVLLYNKTKNQINYKKHIRFFKIYLAVALAFSLSIVYIQHNAWTKDQYTGFIDLELNKLTLGGWYHLIFATLEMVIMLLFFAMLTTLIINKNKPGFLFAEKLVWVFFLYSACAIPDLLVKLIYVAQEHDLVKGFIKNVTDLKVFAAGILVVIAYYLLKVFHYSKWH